jgi:UDP-N-acetylglucosamine acyltransferase
MFRCEESRLVLGARYVIREYVTMNPGTEQGGLVTRIGDDGLFLTGAHIAHDCQVGNNVLLVNNATLGGHCVVEDHASIGGLSAVHQFVRIGVYAFIGGMSGIENDVIPFGMALGNRANLAGLNIVGLKRRGFDREQIHTLRKAYRMLFATEGTLLERLEDVEKMFPEDEAVQRIVRFIRADSSRSFCVPR